MHQSQISSNMPCFTSNENDNKHDNQEYYHTGYRAQQYNQNLFMSQQFYDQHILVPPGLNTVNYPSLPYKKG